MKNLKFELLKTVRNKFMVFVSVILLLGNASAAFYLSAPESDAMTENYGQGVSFIISDAERRYTMLEDKNGFSARYYSQIIEKYSALDTESAPQTVSGWGRYLCYTYTDLLLLLCCAFCSAYEYRREKEIGEMPTLYSSVNGRGRYVLTKLTASAVTTVSFAVLFCLTALIGVGFKNGFAAFSGGGARLQDLKAFVYAPYEISVIKAVFVSFLYKIPVCLAVSFFAGSVSYIFNSGAASLICSSVIIYASYAVNSASYIDKNAFLCNCNVFAAMRPSYIFGELRSVNVFGYAVPSYIMNAVLPVGSAILLGAVFALLHLKRVSVTVKLPKLKLKIKKREKPAKPHGIYRFELKKLVKSRLTLILLIVLFAARLAVTLIDIYTFSYDEKVYREYCYRWEGCYPEQIQTELAEEGAKIGTGYRAYNAMMYGGSVDDVDDPRALADYYLTHKNAYDEFVAKIGRLSDLAEQGVEVPVVYEGGYERFFDSGADIFMILAVIYVCTFLSCYDSANNSTDIIRTTKNGAGRLPKIRLAAASSVCCLIYALFTVIPFAVTACVCGMPSPGSPVYVVPGYEVNGAMPLWLYVLMIFILRLIGTAALCLFSLGISALFKKQVAALGVTAGIYVIPSVLLRGSPDLTARMIEPSLLLDGSGFMQLYKTPAAFAVSVVICVIIPVIIFVPYIKKRTLLK